MDYLKEYEGIKPYEGHKEALVESFRELCDTPDYGIFDVMGNNPWLKRGDAVSVVTSVFSLCEKNK